jgi:hypothetical protein
MDEPILDGGGMRIQKHDPVAIRFDGFDDVETIADHLLYKCVREALTAINTTAAWCNCVSRFTERLCGRGAAPLTQ